MKGTLTARPRAVLYLRVSTKEQASNYSLGTQETACRAYCDANEYEVVRVFREEGESAKTTNRPAFLEMIAYCTSKNANVQYVVVFDLSRWSRNAEDSLVYSAALARKGVLLRSTREVVDETPQGIFLKGLFSLVHQLDNDTRAMRTTIGMRQALANGRWTWKQPIGYSRVGVGRESKLVIDPVAAQLVRRAFERIATGLYTKQQVLAELTAQGLRRRSGKQLTPQDFQRMLTNQFYVGMVSSPKWQTTHAGEHPPLIDRETFDRVQAILSGRRTAVVPHLRNRDDFPLRNFVRCGACQRPLTGSIVKEKYAYYYCPNSGCRAAKARREVFETAFIRFLEEQQPQPAYLKLFAAVVRDVWRKKNREAEEALTACRQQIRSLKDRREKLIDAMLDGRLTEFEARERLDRLNDDIVAAEAVEKEKHIGSTRRGGRPRVRGTPSSQHGAPVARREPRSEAAVTARDFPEGAGIHRRKF